MCSKLRQECRVIVVTIFPFTATPVVSSRVGDRPKKTSSASRWEPIYLHVEGLTHPPLVLMTETPFMPPLANQERLREIAEGAPACCKCRHFKPYEPGHAEGVCMKLMRTTVYHHTCADYNA